MLGSGPITNTSVGDTLWTSQQCNTELTQRNHARKHLLITDEFKINLSFDCSRNQG